MIKAVKRIFPVALSVLGLLLVDTPAFAETSDPEAPGDWRGYAFDTCRSPSIARMKTWWEKSEFKAVGIYTSGNSRACPTDGTGAKNNPKNPNLTPSWVKQVADMGWSFIPIHVGYQAPCFTRPKSTKKVMSTDLVEAASQGKSDAQEAVTANQKFGFKPGSVIYLDIEAFPRGATCDNAVLAFTDAWTKELHEQGYKSGLYSSGASAIKLISDARTKNENFMTWPDHMWTARWSGSPLSGVDKYLSTKFWTDGQRIHQYTGGTLVKRGGVTINIDKNFMTVGKGSVATTDPQPCGVRMSWSGYPTLKSKSKDARVKTLQCLLKEAGFYEAAISGIYDTNTINAVKNYRTSKRWSRGDGKSTTRGLWTALLSRGSTPGVLKYGSTGEDVWRLQRSLNATLGGGVKITGVYNSNTATAVKKYRKRLKITQYRTAEPHLWPYLQKGR